MKIAYNWLKSLLNFTATPEEVADYLTQTGLEVVHTETFRFLPENLVVGKIIESLPHPNADTLRKTLVDIGKEKPLSIICGAPNATAGKKVVVAPIGTCLCLPNNKKHKIKKVKIRNEVSEGMICAEDEIGLGDQHDQIITLTTQCPPGTPLDRVWNTPPDTIFDIELTPNRNDATSHLGVARDLAAVLGRPLQKPLVTPLIPDDSMPIHIVVKDKKACPRYTGVVISDIQIAPSPMWIQSRLKSIGIRPINNVVDITNFLMHDIGQPLHAFDYDQIEKKKITVGECPQGTLFLGLDGVERKLTGKELMISDTEGPLCMAGIIGAARGKITRQTRTIFLESAYFSPLSIAQTAKEHQIHTDSSFRFIRGADPEMPYIALQRAAYMIHKYTKGKIASMFEDHYHTKVHATTCVVTYAYITRILGFEIPPEKIHKIVENLDITLRDITDTSFTAVVPPYRKDVVRPIDIVEEILRIYGYNKVKTNKAPIHSYPQKAHDNYTPQTKISIKKLLAAKGYHEIITNALTHSAYAPKANKASSILLANPLNRDLDALRQTLLHTGLAAVQHNLHRKQNNIRLFETGKVYINDGESFHEVEKLALWLAGNKEETHWSVSHKKNNFFDLCAIVQHLCAHSGIPSTKSVQCQHPYYTACLTLYKEDTILGHLGQVAPAMLEMFGLKETVFFAEIDFHMLLQPKVAIKYQPISKFPPVNRDISLAIDQCITFAQIRQVIDNEQIKFLQKTALIDYYRSPSLGEKQKSYTLHLTLQSNKRTLTALDINKAVNRLTKALEEQLGATIRS